MAIPASTPLEIASFCPFTLLTQRHMEGHGFDLEGQPQCWDQKHRASSVFGYADRRHTADNSTIIEREAGLMISLCDTDEFVLTSSKPAVAPVSTHVFEVL